MKRPQKVNQQGFTVVELLVATVVFGAVLLVVTIAILQLTRVYYKGITEKSTQEIARNIADSIAQSIQFNGGIVTTSTNPGGGAPYAFCVGNQQYTAITGRQLTDTTPGTNQSRRVLVVRKLAGCTSTSGTAPMDGSGTDRELLAPKMRLAKLDVAAVGTSGDVYKITVRVVYGDDDLLTNPTDPDTTCERFQQGTQFCAISDLTTIVTKRVK